MGAEAGANYLLMNRSNNRGNKRRGGNGIKITAYYYSRY